MHNVTYPSKQFYTNPYGKKTHLTKLIKTFFSLKNEHDKDNSKNTN